YRLASLPFAFVGSLHERINLEGLFGGNGGFSAAEEKDNLDDKRPVTLVGAKLLNAAGAEGRSSVIRLSSPFARTNSTKGADASPFPDAGSQIHRRRRDARYRLAARSHDCKECLDAMDPVPEKIGMSDLEGTGAVGVASFHFADFSTADRLCAA